MMSTTKERVLMPNVENSGFELSLRLCPECHGNRLRNLFRTDAWDFEWCDDCGYSYSKRWIEGQFDEAVRTRDIVKAVYTITGVDISKFV
jgi:NMD protein affecting ribosome stability and mRNA decay